MYQFIQIHPKNTEGPIQINGHYIEKIYSHKKITHLNIIGFPTIQVHDSKYKVRRLLKLNPAQQSREIKINLPSLHKSFPNQKIIPLSKLVYIRPLKNGKLKLTFYDKKDCYPEETLESIQKLINFEQMSHNTSALTCASQ